MSGVAALAASACGAARPSPAAAQPAPAAAAAELATAPGPGATPSPPEAPFAPVTAADAGLDQAALAALVARAEESGSDALVVLADGKLVGEWTFGSEPGPIEAMSATKSIVSLAIGKLIDQGVIRSVDEPVHTFYPEWKQGKKQAITIRHLLDHTSGLQNVPNTGVEIYPSPDFVKLALAAELSSDPGTRFSYNNKAVNLLAGIVEVASGQRMDEYIGAEIFAPMGITDYTWTRDDAGNPHAMSGLQIRAMDLAKIGQMMLDGGTWRGQRILSQEWIAASTRPGELVPSCGLLWWLLPEWQKLSLTGADLDGWLAAGADEAVVAKLRPMAGKLYTKDQLRAELQRRLGKRRSAAVFEGLSAGTFAVSVVAGPIRGFYADGYLGQYLVVVPEARLVAVRQMRAPETEEELAAADSFREFSQMVLALVP